MSGFNSKHWLILSLSFLSAAVLADSETCTWTGAVNNNWSENRNWNPHVPGSTDKALIKATVNIVIDQDYTRESPACQALQIGDNDIQTYSVTFSGGHTLFVLGNGGFGGYKNIKSVCKLCSAEITGSGTKVYFDDQVTGKDYFINVSGPLVVSAGAYAEFDRANFGTVTARGSDSNGVRSKLKWGKGQNDNMPASTIIADAADVVWYSNSSGVKFTFNTSSVRPSIIARNSGTNDCSVANWGNGSNPYVTAESGGVVLLGGFSTQNSDTTPMFTINNGKAVSRSFNPHYGATSWLEAGRYTTVNFSGENPVLECTANNTCSLILGEIAKNNHISLNLEPRVAWGSRTEGLFCVSGTGNTYSQISTNCLITIDVTKLDEEMTSDSITFPLITMPNTTSSDGVKPPEGCHAPVVLTGTNSGNYTAETLPRLPNINTYTIKISKSSGTAKGLCIIFF